jgi:hypothetical protein
VLQNALKLASLDSFLVSETDILHGILLDAAARLQTDTPCHQVIVSPSLKTD